MRALLFFAFGVLALNVQSSEIKKDTIDKYIIDKQVIERFNGSQLEGKTISKYIIGYKDTGNFVEKIHFILTGNESVSFSNTPIKQSKYEGLVIVDGKEMSSDEFSKMNAKDIAGMKVYKAGSKVAESYGELGKNGVLWITTKANKTSENIYFIDGRRVEKGEVDKLSPDRIASMSVNKEEGNSVVLVVTKK